MVGVCQLARASCSYTDSADNASSAVRPVTPPLPRSAPPPPPNPAARSRPPPPGSGRSRAHPPPPPPHSPHPPLPHPRLQQPDLGRRPPAQVDHAPMRIGPPVVDADHHRL